MSVTVRKSGRRRGVLEPHVLAGKLAESEKRFKMAFDFSPTGIGISSPSGRYLAVSPALCRMLGYTEPELLGRSLLDVTHPDDRIAGAERLERLRSGGLDGYQITKRYLHKDGHLIWVLLSVSAVRDEDGKVTQLIAQSQDVSSLRWAEAELADSLSLLRTTQEIGNIGSFIAWISTDKAGTDDWSPACMRIFGYDESKRSISNDEFWARVHPDDLERVHAEQDKAYASGNTYDLQHRIVRPDGAVRWIHERAAIERDEAGNPMRFVGVTRDITDEKLAEHSLRASESRFRSAFQDSGVGIILTAHPGIVRQANRAFCEMLGHTEAELVGVEVGDLLFDEDVEQDQPEIDRLLRGEIDLHTTVHRFRHADGHTIIWARVHLSVVRGADGVQEGFVAQIEDITGQRVAEAALRATERRFQGAFYGSGIGMNLTTPDGIVVQVNSAMCEMLGRTESELIGHSFHEHLYEDDFVDLAEIGRLFQGEKEVHTTTRRHRHADGHLVWGRVHLSIVRKPDGSPEYVLAQVEDITQARVAKEALRASQTSHTLIVAAALDCIVALDAESLITEFNPAAERTFGFRRAEVLGRSLYGTIVPERFLEEDRRGIAAFFKDRVDGFGGRRTERVGLRADGTEFPIEVSVSRLETPHGDAYSASIRDLSERDQLRDSEDRLAAVVSNAPGIVWSTDAAGIVTLAVGRGLELLDATETQLIGGPAGAIFGPDDHIAAALATALGGQAVANVLHESAPLGIWFETSLSPLLGADGQVTGTLAVTSDVSERIDAEKARNESETKSRIVAMVNHEVRTPLNSILGFTELLQSERAGPLNDKQRRWMANVDSAGRHLLALVNDSLDLSKITAGQMDVDIDALELTPILAQAGEQIQPLANSREIEVSLESVDGTWVMADRRRLLQILWNLLSNAVRHTPTGGHIKIQSRTVGDQVEILVHDTGSGIPAADMERIFDEFTQVAGQKEGTGLGLPVSLRLAKLMQGDIRAESEVGVGSTFTVILPRGHTLSR